MSFDIKMNNLSYHVVPNIFDVTSDNIWTASINDILSYESVVTLGGEYVFEDMYCDTVYQRALYSIESMEGGVLSDTVYNGIYYTEELIIGNGITTIMYDGLGGAEKLKKVTLLEGVENLGDFAFSNSQSLETIIIPHSVKEIGEIAFGHCISLTDIYYAGTIEEWQQLVSDELSYEGTPSTLTVHCSDGDWLPHSGN